MIRPTCALLLGEVLCRAGYKAVTTGNVHDAQILLRATKAKLVVLGANMQSVHGASTKKAMEEIDPAVSLVVLDGELWRPGSGRGCNQIAGNHPQQNCGDSGVVFRPLPYDCNREMNSRPNQ